VAGHGANEAACYAYMMAGTCFWLQSRHYHVCMVSIGSEIEGWQGMGLMRWHVMHTVYGGRHVFLAMK